MTVFPDSLTKRKINKKFTVSDSSVIPKMNIIGEIYGSHSGSGTWHCEVW
jgi:hypothetical protein